MAVEMISLASGSSGNAILLRSGRHSLLIDDGISYKKLSDGLQRMELTPQDIDGLLLTHEHTDHTRGLPLFLKKTTVPVYLTAGTYTAMQSSLPENGGEDRFRQISPRSCFRIGPFEVLAFPVLHDAAEPVAFRITAEEHRLAVVTDIGSYDEETVEALRGLEAIYIEANHDPHMLELGPYPYELKLRIAGRLGHLSNEDCGRLLAASGSDCLCQVMLGHLSRENNYPPLALAAVRAELSAAGAAEMASRLRLIAAPRTDLSEIISL